MNGFSRNSDPCGIARLCRMASSVYTRPYDGMALCEKILIDAGRAEEGYQTFGLHVRPGTSYLNSFRAIVKKYPQKDPAAILKDIVERSKGEEGSWFATAKSLGFLDLALELANRSPCDPITLSKAARDFAAENPAFALEAGMASLRWLLAGNYYEITGIDVHAAVSHTLAAAKTLGKEEETLRRIRELIESPQAVETIAKGLIKSALYLRASGKQIPEKLIERARKSRAGRWRSSQYNREKLQWLEGDENPG